MAGGGGGRPDGPTIQITRKNAARHHNIVVCRTQQQWKDLNDTVVVDCNYGSIPLRGAMLRRHLAGKNNCGPPMKNYIYAHGSDYIWGDLGVKSLYFVFFVKSVKYIFSLWRLPREPKQGLKEIFLDRINDSDENVVCMHDMYFIIKIQCSFAASFEYLYSCVHDPLLFINKQCRHPHHRESQ